MFADDSVWDIIHALLMIMGTLISIQSSSTIGLVLLAAASFAYYTTLNTGPAFAYKPFRTYANWITAGRLLILMVMMAVWPQIQHVYLVVGLIVIVLLDRVDGHVARRYKQESSWGRACDVEVDSLYVLFCCIYLYLNQIAPVWIVIPGLMRYSYIIILKIINPSVQKERKNKIASYVAGIFFISLLWSIAYTSAVQHIVLIVSSALIVLSFLISYYYLWIDNRNSRSS